MKKAIRAFHRTAFITTPLYGSAAWHSIAQRRNGFMPARQFCDGGGGFQGMELPVLGR
jgi:hypothetical protein